MPYTYITFAEAKGLLAAILTDASKVRFIDDELGLYIAESLRTFAGLTGMWEVQTSPAAIAAGTIFVDLPVTFADVRGYTLQDRDLIGIMQYHLLERKSVAAWTGTERFTLDDLTQAIQRRRNQFLLETGCRLTHIVTPIDPLQIEAGDDALDLDQSVIDVHRACWQTIDGKVTPLWRDSRTGLRSANVNWNLEPGLPRVYRLAERAPISVEFGPLPLNAGRLDLLAIEAGADLNPVAGVLLGIPDDFAWAVKWGALADLLSKDGPARDYARALFCERRYRMGVAAAVSYKPVADVRINGRTLQIDTIEHLDMARQYWQSKTGTPVVAALSGFNILALEQPPRTACSLSVLLTSNVPVPTADDEPLQIGKEYLDIILNYAVHLAMFKIGGQELAATTQLAESFFLAAADYNQELKQQSVWEEEVYSEPKSASMKDRGIRRVTGSTVGEAS